MKMAFCLEGVRPDKKSPEENVCRYPEKRSAASIVIKAAINTDKDNRIFLFKANQYLLRNRKAGADSYNKS